MINTIVLYVSETHIFNIYNLQKFNDFCHVKFLYGIDNPLLSLKLTNDVKNK